MPPTPSAPAAKRETVAALLGAAGEGAELLAAVGDAFVAYYDALSARHLLPYLPAELARVPRAKVRFLAIENAWFSVSMNYLGHARRADGSPEYEATYELNAALEISVPQFQQLVSHEVVPGHVTTFAYLQDLFVRLAGFEASVLTMNTPASCCSRAGAG